MAPERPFRNFDGCRLFRMHLVSALGRHGRPCRPRPRSTVAGSRSAGSCLCGVSSAPAVKTCCRHRQRGYASQTERAANNPLLSWNKKKPSGRAWLRTTRGVNPGVPRGTASGTRQIMRANFAGRYRPNERGLHRKTDGPERGAARPAIGKLLRQEACPAYHLGSGAALATPTSGGVVWAVDQNGERQILV